MKPATGLADHGFVSALWIVRCDFIRQPVLHVHSGPGTLEDDVVHFSEHTYAPSSLSPLIQINAAERRPMQRLNSGTLVLIRPGRRLSCLFRPVSPAQPLSIPDRGRGRGRGLDGAGFRLKMPCPATPPSGGFEKPVAWTRPKLHFPFGIRLELAGNSADDVGANAGQLVPCGVATGKLDTLIGSAGIAAISDTKEIERHGITR